MPKESARKTVVRTYVDGFRRLDHDAILACLTDDVVWEMPGYFSVVGKEAFDGEIENDTFVGAPELTIRRLVEEGRVVVAEGTVHVRFRSGEFLDAVFCDVFRFRDDKISSLVSYQVNLPSPAPGQSST